jgi:hypothetical protein
MSSSGKRALIVVAVLCLILAGVAVYYVHGHGSSPVVVTSIGGPPELLSLLPADAPVVVFGDVAALKKSAAFGEGSILLSPGVAEEPQYKEFVRETGFDYTRDLDRFVIAAWPDKNKSSQEGSPVVPLIALADGRFDRQKIDAYARRIGSVSKSGDADIYETPAAVPGQKILFTFLAPGRIAIAQAMGLDPILHPLKANSSDADARARIARVSGAEFFAVARTDDLPKEIGIPGVQTGQLNRLLKSVRSITLSGHPDGNNFIVAAEADCDSLPNAFQLATLLDTLRWLGRAALADPKTRAQMHPNDAALLDSLLRVAAVSHESHSVRLRLELTPAILQSTSKAH